MRIDKVYFNDTDLSHDYGQARRRDLSKQKICIAIGIDRAQGAGVRRVRIRKAVVRVDKESARNVYREGHDAHPRPRKVTRRAGEGERARRRELQSNVRGPAYLQVMKLVNSLWL